MQMLFVKYWYCLNWGGMLFVKYYLKAWDALMHYGHIIYFMSTEPNAWKHCRIYNKMFCVLSFAPFECNTCTF